MYDNELNGKNVYSRSCWFAITVTRFPSSSGSLASGLLRGIFCFCLRTSTTMKTFQRFLQIPLLYLLLSIFIVKKCYAQTTTNITLTPSVTGSWTQSGAGNSWFVDAGPCWSVSLSHADPCSYFILHKN